jgi:hypothetical protein
MSSVLHLSCPDCDSDAPKNLFDFVAWKRRQLRQNRLPSNRAHDTVVAAVTQIAVTLTRRQGRFTPLRPLRLSKATPLLT